MSRTKREIEADQEDQETKREAERQAVSERERYRQAEAIRTYESKIGTRRQAKLWSEGRVDLINGIKERYGLVAIFPSSTHDFRSVDGFAQVPHTATGTLPSSWIAFHANVSNGTVCLRPNQIKVTVFDLAKLKNLHALSEGMVGLSVLYSDGSIESYTEESLATAWNEYD